MLSGYVGVFIATLISGEQSQAAMAKNIELYAFVKKRFKKRAGFLRNAPQKQFGLRIARYFNRFPFQLVISGIKQFHKMPCGMWWH